MNTLGRTTLRLRVASAMVAAALVLTGCADILLPSAEPEAKQPVPKDLSVYLEQTAEWGECDAEVLLPVDETSVIFGQTVVECSSVLVPAVYDTATITAEFEIQMMRMRWPGDEPRRGHIFINPGGPGGSGIEQLQYSDFPQELLENYNIVGFDPRGVGASVFADGSTIKCSDQLDYASYFMESSPADEKEYDRLIKEADRYYEDCIANNPLWWTLSTAHVVDDLDIMRQAVSGDEPLHFIGSSYGTRIASQYVTEFPEHVGFIVLDSPVTVDTDPIASYLEDLAANEEKLVTRVENYADYAGLSFDEAFDRLLQIRQWADDGEIYGFAGYEPASTVDAMLSSEALFQAGIFAMNYLPEDEAAYYFNGAIDELWVNRWNGTFEWFGLWLDGYEPDALEGGNSLEEKNIIRSNEYEIRVIVNTMDFSEPPYTEEQQRDLSQRSKEIAPHFTALYQDASGYEYFGPPKGLSWYQIAIDDPVIPDPPDTPFVPANTSGKKLLIIGATRESVTPFAFAGATADLLASPLITVDTSMHAPAAYYTNSCVTEALLDYFVREVDMTDRQCGDADLG